MNMGKVYSVVITGLEATLIEVEVDSRNGLPAVSIVGLADTAVKESKERVLSALKNVGYVIPTNKVITINLSPADIRKVGSLYDLPIALGILSCSGQFNWPAERKMIVAGELGLDGQVKSVHGALLMSVLAKEKSMDLLIVPKANEQEISLIEGIPYLAATSLQEVIEGIQKNQTTLTTRLPTLNETTKKVYNKDIRDVRGQMFAKRALEIAAAGGHHLLLIGPPGCGKSMLAERMPGILPELTESEQVEVVKIYSVSGKLNSILNHLSIRPFRSPHATISYPGLVGGTAYSKPGEISLAHRGVLFLDELPEFSRQALESLRYPLETGQITISRASQSTQYPAEFLLIASANPCPCGYATHPVIPCRCTPFQKQRYKQKLSGPVLDRFDMMVDMQPLKEGEIWDKPKGESSSSIRRSVEKARQRQIQRSKSGLYCTNAHIQGEDLDSSCRLDQSSKEILNCAIKKYHLSSRAIHKLLRVSRTIADLVESETISPEHVLESLQFRLDTVDVSA